MDLSGVLGEMDEMALDYSVPRRVRNTLSKVASDLKKDGQDVAVKVTSAVYDLDEIANDVNIPMHVKTGLWDIISHLEAMKK